MSDLEPEAAARPPVGSVVGLALPAENRDADRRLIAKAIDNARIVHHLELGPIRWTETEAGVAGEALVEGWVAPTPTPAHPVADSEETETLGDELMTDGEEP
jgi:hypothetical protein